MGQFSKRTRVENLFEHLCIDLGYCLSAEDYFRISKKLPLSIDAFADEVLLAEGFQSAYSKQLKKEVKKLAANWFQEEVKNDDF